MLALRVILPVLLVKVAILLAALDDCPEANYFNGTQCTPCTACPPGFGVKTKCTPKGDTECHACWPSHDYSNTTGFEPCIGCHTYSNCLEGQFKIIKNCTIFGPYVCDGCADGNFFDPGSGIKGACVQCRGPCSSLEKETSPCRTGQDRMCTAKSARPTILVSSSDSMDSERIVTRSTSTTSNRVSAKTVHLGLAAEGTKPTATFIPKPWVWIVAALAAAAIILIAIIVTIICRRGRNPKRDEEADRDVPELQQRIPLMPPTTGRNEQGLNLPIKDLTIDGKKFIAQLLNDRDNYSIFYWEITAEKLGLAAESRSWKGAQNPTGMLLTAYGEKADSTLRNLIKALREADLTHFAAEIEKAFSGTTQD